MRGDRARSALRDTRFARLDWVEETGSTNTDLLAEARTGAPEGLVLVADHQTAGRGRLGRHWEAPPGSSLLVSVLLRPPLAPADAFLATMALGVSAVQACAEVAGVLAGLKWPNDLLVEGGGDSPRKLGGMLAETLVDSSGLTLVAGLGLNVNWPEPLPGELAEIAVAMNHLTGEDVDREDLLVALLRLLERHRVALEDDRGRAELRDRYREVCGTLGRRVRVDLGQDQIEGEAVDLTASGHLVVEVGPGRSREVVAGDVVHLR